MILDDAWVFSLLAAIQTRSTQKDLVALYLRWREEIEGHAERKQILEAFAKRKEEVRRG